MSSTQLQCRLQVYSLDKLKHMAIKVLVNASIKMTGVFNKTQKKYLLVVMNKNE